MPVKGDICQGDEWKYFNSNFFNNNKIDKLEAVKLYLIQVAHGQGFFLMGGWGDKLRDRKEG